VLNLYSDPDFQGRRLHVRDAPCRWTGLAAWLVVFVEKPQALLQELVNAAVDPCGAKSAGISLQRRDERGETFYEWVRIA
jgi:hypothetical protein